ncbi:MAG: hypothetical protein WA869_28325 [Alloacidobacterium sp.]
MARKSSGISGQFAAHLVAMLESPAWRVLSLSARKVLDRVEIELAHHGGRDNGQLPVTYDDFVNYGVHRHSIRPAINELVALGFLEITRAGRAGNVEFRLPNQFRLTYRPSKGVPGDGSHEWKAIKSDEEAERLAKAARLEKSKSQCRKSTRPNDENRHRKLKTHSPKTITTAYGSEIVTTFNISGKVSPAEPAREARPPQGAVASEPAAPDFQPFVDDKEIDAAVQARLADRLGKYGWSALVSLNEQELERVTRLEAAGTLDDRELSRLRALGAASQAATIALRP